MMLSAARRRMIARRFSTVCALCARFCREPENGSCTQHAVEAANCCRTHGSAVDCRGTVAVLSIRFSLNECKHSAVCAVCVCASTEHCATSSPHHFYSIPSEFCACTQLARSSASPSHHSFDAIVSWASKVRAKKK